MALTSIIRYRDLKNDLVRAIESYTKKYLNKASNGNLGIYYKIRFILLKRYVDYILNRKQYYFPHESDMLYLKDEIILYNDLLYICIKNNESIVLPVDIATSEDFSPYPLFEYNYNELISIIDRINKICKTNISI